MSDWKSVFDLRRPPITREHFAAQPRQRGLLVVEREARADGRHRSSGAASVIFRSAVPGWSSENCSTIVRCALSTRPTSRARAPAELSMESSRASAATSVVSAARRVPFFTSSSATRRERAESARSSENCETTASRWASSARATVFAIAATTPSASSGARSLTSGLAAPTCDVLGERPREGGAVSAEVAGEEAVELPVPLRQPLESLREGAARRVEVLGERRGEGLGEVARPVGEGNVAHGRDEARSRFFRIESAPIAPLASRRHRAPIRRARTA